MRDVTLFTHNNKKITINERRFHLTSLMKISVKSSWPVGIVGKERRQQPTVPAELARLCATRLVPTAKQQTTKTTEKQQMACRHTKQRHQVDATNCAPVFISNEFTSSGVGWVLLCCCRSLLGWNCQRWLLSPVPPVSSAINKTSSASPLPAVAFRWQSGCSLPVHFRVVVVFFDSGRKF